MQTHNIGRYNINHDTGHAWSGDVESSLMEITGGSRNEERFKQYIKNNSSADSMGRIHFTSIGGDPLVLVPKSRYDDNTEFTVVHKNSL